MSQGCAGLCCQDMVRGQSYTFHFSYSGWLQVAVDPNDVSKAVAKDSNFSSPAATVNEGGLLKKGTVSVSFIYNGQGSIVGQAGQEMQNVINAFWVTGVGTSLVFSHADTGIVNCCCCSSDPGNNYINIILFGVVGIIALAVLLPEVFSFEALKGR